MTRELSYLRLLEAEAVLVIREVDAEFERPVLMCSGGKDASVGALESLLADSGIVRAPRSATEAGYADQGSTLLRPRRSAPLLPEE